MVVLWLWPRPAVVALIQPIARELPCAAYVVLKKKQKKNKKKQKKRKKKRGQNWRWGVAGVQGESGGQVMESRASSAERECGQRPR